MTGSVLSLNGQAARKVYPQGWKAPRPYIALCRNRSAKPHSAGYPAWETRPRASAALSFRRSVRAFAWRLKNE